MRYGLINMRIDEPADRMFDVKNRTVLLFALFK